MADYRAMYGKRRSSAPSTPSCCVEDDQAVEWPDAAASSSSSSSSPPGSSGGGCSSARTGNNDNNAVDDDELQEYFEPPPRMPLGSYNGALSTISETPWLRPGVTLALPEHSGRRSAVLTLPSSTHHRPPQSPPPHRRSTYPTRRNSSSGAIQRGEKEALHQNYISSNSASSCLLVDFPHNVNKLIEDFPHNTGSGCILDNYEKCKSIYDSKGRCIHHPHVKLRKRPLLFGLGTWKVVRITCPYCFPQATMMVECQNSSEIENVMKDEGSCDDDTGDDDDHRLKKEEVHREKLGKSVRTLSITESDRDVNVTIRSLVISESDRDVVHNDDELGNAADVATSWIARHIRCEEFGRDGDETRLRLQRRSTVGTHSLTLDDDDDGDSDDDGSASSSLDSREMFEEGTGWGSEN